MHRDSGLSTALFTTALATMTILLALPPGYGQEIDFGDHRSTTLTSKAWDALGSGNLTAAMTYVEKCISLYQEEAKSMEASLSTFPANEPKEETFKYWALNDVGTCYFIMGEILMKQGNTMGAKNAYDTCARDFSFAQCWDPKGWFWKPGEAAKQKSLELEYDVSTDPPANSDWPSP